MLDECLLQGVKFTVLGQTFNCSDLFARYGLHLEKTRTNCFPIDKHCARPAKPLSTTVLATG